MDCSGFAGVQKCGGVNPMVRENVGGGGFLIFSGSEEVAVSAPRRRFSHGFQRKGDRARGKADSQSVSVVT